MTIAIEHERTLRRTGDVIAANDDHLGHSAALARALAAKVALESGGWDAYEVWRRLIKEARDRRAGTTFPQP